RVRFPLFSLTAPPPSEVYTLSLHDALPILLAEDVVEAEQILLRLLHLALGRLAPGLVLGDARRLLDEVAAVLWLGRDDQADPPLLDDRVGLGAHPRAEEELDDVEQAARRLVDQVLTLTVAEEPARDRALVQGGVLRGDEP